MKNIFRKLNIPDKPGVYFFLKGKHVLYIGKATSLANRVRSYMSKTLFDMRGPLIEKMVKDSDRIKWQETDSVLEALVLEANLIKKHQPHYNTREKDDKSFNYVCITEEKVPKVVLVRAKSLKSEQCIETFGPFTKGGELREALQIVRRIFPFLDDKNKNYIEFYKQINLLPDLNDTKLYLKNIKNIKLFFSGRKKQILRNLAKQMREYAIKREFEKAGEMKRQIFALKHINDVALLKNHSDIATKREVARIEAYDVAHLSGGNMVGAMAVLQNGELAPSEYKKFKIRTQAKSNDTGALTEILERRLSHQEWQYPSLLVLDGSTAQFHAASEVLDRFKLNIPMVAVVKDERHKPLRVLGDSKIIQKYKRNILLANSEAHRFAIAYHKKLRSRNFLK